MQNAQPKIGAAAMKKSKRKGTFGLSYLIPVLSDVNKFSSVIVVPVTRHSNAWLSSCTMEPGKSIPFTILVLVYFFHSSHVAKLRKIIRIRPIANEKYIIFKIFNQRNYRVNILKYEGKRHPHAFTLLCKQPNTCKVD